MHWQHQTFNKLDFRLFITLTVIKINIVVKENLFEYCYIVYPDIVTEEMPMMSQAHVEGSA
jgi:hypothetical protein